MRILTIIWLVFFLSGCRETKEKDNSFIRAYSNNNTFVLTDASGFSLERDTSGITIIKVSSPWPGAEKSFTYALVPREQLSSLSLDRKLFDAVILIPVQKLVVTSTTHIPALEALGVGDRLVGFPGTDLISSSYTRERIKNGNVVDLGNNQVMNTEMLLSLQPDLVVGFSISSENKAYETLIRSGIPVVYNGDWAEQTPLGKAEWIKFFAPFFEKEEKGAAVYTSIKDNYNKARSLAKNAKNTPTVMSGALYKDIWYTPGGKSWAAQIIKDANADYLWKDSEDAGSLSLSLESMLQKGIKADFWISPSQFTTYSQLENANEHYTQFMAFQNEKIYSYAMNKGETGGLLFFELGPNRPDLILNDLIHIFHPELLPDHHLFFFNPLQ